MTSGFWPFWLGAPALAIVCVGFAWLVRRPMGVSGSFARVVDVLRLRGRGDDQLAGDPVAFEAALVAATRDEFGDAEPTAAAGGQPSPAPPFVMRWTHHVFFLAMVFVGALLAAGLRGHVGLHADLGADFTRLVGTGWRAWSALLVG